MTWKANWSGRGAAEGDPGKRRKRGRKGGSTDGPGELEARKGKTEKDDGRGKERGNETVIAAVALVIWI